jgi:hypothetical protein
MRILRINIAKLKIVGKRRVSLGLSTLCLKNGYEIVALSEFDKDRNIVIRGKKPYESDLEHIYVRELVYENEKHEIKTAVEVLSASYDKNNNEYIDVENIREDFKIKNCIQTEEEIKAAIIEGYKKISSSSII